MATSEIEKLERRYAENPQGLTFAPLAEVHRKNGDVPRALELLTAGLELHPNYIPASIVLGRCHQDLGDLPAAEAAFAHVLRLDDENVIALKSLADINERLKRYDDAESWLRRLVSVDRSNDEAREQLRRLELVKNGKAPLEQAGDVASDSVYQKEERPKRPSAEVAALDPPPTDIAALDLAEAAPVPAPIQDVVPPKAPAEAPPLILERPPEPEPRAPKVPFIAEAPEPTDGASTEPIPGLISQEFEPPKTTGGSPVEPLDIQVETSEEVVLEGLGGSEYRVPNAAEDFSEFMAARAEAGPPDLAVKPPAEPPREMRAAAPREVPVETRRDIAAPTPAAAAAPSYAARVTQGQSVAAFFRTMLAARPPVDSGSARPAQDGLSLSSVIGEERKPGDASVSFDDFFGPQSDGPGGEKGTDPGNDDLDQFHSWLQNLKR
jgi:hypothetical protein